MIQRFSYSCYIISGAVPAAVSMANSPRTGTTAVLSIQWGLDSSGHACEGVSRVG